MKRRTSWHLLLVTLWSLPFISPLLRWSSVPCTHDGHLHYHRVAAIRHMWENGLLFSRWMPDLAFGYGYPFFLYREPLPLYATHFLHLLGLPLPTATNLFYILCILAAGIFTFLWVRDLFGAPAGFLSAIAYMSAPYQLVDALVRGNQVESTALAIFPFLLWAGRRYVMGVGGRGSGAGRWFLATVGGLIVLGLSHNISLLLFTPTLAVYLVFVAWVEGRKTEEGGRMTDDGRGGRARLGFYASATSTFRAISPSLARIALVFALGLGTTSFYTAPAVLEIGEVTLSQSTTSRNNDFHFNFTSLDEIFAPVTPEDPSLINPPLPFRLGWVPAGLALIGLTTLAFNKNREQRAHIILMAIGTVGFLLFSLPISLPLWENLPLVEFIQFPWRLVGRAALPVALLAGASTYYFGFWIGDFGLGRPRTTHHAPRTMHLLRIVYCVLPVLLFVETVPNLYPNMCTEALFPNIGSVHEYEHVTGLVGVDPEGSYFPRTVQRRPAGSPLEADYEADRTPQRFDSTQLPAGAELINVKYGHNTAIIELDTPMPFTAQYQTYAFPGWVVRINGERVPVIPSVPLGLMTFDVPAGHHTITVDWELTPLRAIFGATSVLSLVGIVVVVRRGDGGRKTEDGRVAAGRWSLNTEHWSLNTGRWLLVIGVMVVAAKWLVVDRVESSLRRVTLPPVAHPAGLTAGELRFQGFNLSRDVVPAGETFDIDLAWVTVGNPAGAYQSNIWLEDENGLLWSDKETHRPRIYETAPPTFDWQPGQWAWDSREVQVLSGTPPGRYNIVLTTFTLDDLQPLTLIDSAGARVGPTAIIGHIDVIVPDEPPEFTPQHSLEASFSNQTLLGYNQDRTEAAPGEPVLLTLFWENTAHLTDFVHVPTFWLRTEAGETVTQLFLPIGYPNWQPTERARNQELLRLPASLESGNYQFYADSTPLGTINVTAPPRLLDLPEYDVSLNISFADQLTLVGYTIAPSPNLSLSLIWQGEAEMTTSYRVFVHVLDSSGQIVAQSDGEPAGWTRPTTGWIPGEYIVDNHELAVPAGDYHFRVGVYDPATNLRLNIDSESDFVTIMP